MKDKFDNPLALGVFMFKPPIPSKRVRRDRLQTPKPSQHEQKKVQGIKGKEMNA